MSASLSVVVPVHNEADYLPATLRALVEALERSEFAAELVLVDDGSTDGSAGVATEAVAERLPMRVVAQPNRGRFEARRAGIEAATAEWVLLLDGRVRLRPGSLAFVHERLADGQLVWNGHVHVETGRNAYGAFWKALAEVAWREYFDDPRTTSFDARVFDRYPKGMGCFLAPRQTLLAAFDVFRSRYADVRNANDDTPLLRSIAAWEQIHLSPSFACDYSPRATLLSFLRHSVHRGIVFLDGHGRRESRFFPVVVAFFPTSAALALLSSRRPALVPATAASGLSLAAGAAAIAAGRSRFETASLAALAPVYALAHGAGMWWGLTMLGANRLRRGKNA